MVDDRRRAAIAAADGPVRQPWTPAAATPIVLGALRIVSALMLMQHGVQKLFGQLGGFGGTPGATAPVGTRSWIAGVLEVGGGALLALGLFTRPVAFVLSGLLAVAYFQAHAPQGFWPVLNRGELAALYSFVFLLLAAAGPGAASLDGLRAGRRR